MSVDCPIDDAFRLFTEEFQEWWPLALYSVSGSEAEECVLEPWAGGRVFERTRSGEELEWGEVRTWDPPRRLSFSWDPGGIGSESQRVDVEFEREADGTRVTLTHTGWETPGVAVCAAGVISAPNFSEVLARFFLEHTSEPFLVMA